MEGKERKKERERNRVRMGQYDMKEEEKSVKKKQHCFACYQERKKFFEPCSIDSKSHPKQSTNHQPNRNFQSK